MAYFDLGRTDMGKNGTRIEIYFRVVNLTLDRGIRAVFIGPQSYEVHWERVYLHTPSINDGPFYLVYAGSFESLRLRLRLEIGPLNNLVKE